MELAGIGFFLEVAIVGAGATVWFFLATLSIAGYRWINPELFDAEGLLLLVLPIAFILGIIVDELGDSLAGKFKGPIRKRELGEARAKKMISLRREAYLSAYDKQALDYARRRLRIARGWIVNSLALVVTLNTFIWFQLPGSSSRAPLALWGSVGALLLALGSYLATRSLLTSECHILKGISESASAGIPPRTDSTEGST